MNDTDAVRGRKRTGDLDSDFECFNNCEGASSNSIAQRVAVDELRGDELFGIDLVDLVDGQNVWMIECRSGFGFLHKAPHAIPGIVSDFGRLDFECDFSIELRIVSEVNLAHATRAELGA